MKNDISPKVELTDLQIKNMLKEILISKDTCKEIILNNIIFSLAENIDWQLVYTLILNYMPDRVETINKRNGRI